MTAFRRLSSITLDHHCRCDSNGPANASSIACRLRMVVSRRTGIHERVFKDSARQRKYPALTCIRAVGASVVFYDHFPVWADAHVTLNVMAFFYALSGFLILRIRYEQAQLRLRWLAKYFANRFARIYPVYFRLPSFRTLTGSEKRGDHARMQAHWPRPWRRSRRICGSVNQG